MSLLGRNWIIEKSQFCRRVIEGMWKLLGTIHAPVLGPIETKPPWGNIYSGGIGMSTFQKGLSSIQNTTGNVPTVNCFIVLLFHCFVVSLEPLQKSAIVRQVESGDRLRVAARAEDDPGTPAHNHIS